MFRRLVLILTFFASLLAVPARAADDFLFVHSLSETNAPLPGACFEVYRDAGNGARGDYDNAFCDKDDGQDDGNTVVQAAAGNYVLAESVVPAGYTAAPDTPVSLIDGKVQQVSIVHTLTTIPPTPTPAPTPTFTPNPTGDVMQERFAVGPGRNLFIHCTGSGGPTVILEAGGPGQSSDSWAPVQDLLGAQVRTCSYDRASLGQSDPAPESRRTIQDSAADLHTLITAAALDCPCVFVGSSWGGAIVRVYAGLFPGDVAGMVFVDGIPPGFVEDLLALVPNDSTEDAQAARDRLLGSDNLEHIDQLTSLRLADEVTLPKGIPAAVMTHDQTTGLGFSPSLPVAKLEDAWRADQQRFADSLNARLIVAEKSGNNLVAQQPDLVVATVQYVLSVIQNPENRFGRIQILPITSAGKPLPGACFQLWTDPGTGTRGTYVNAACDGDDGVNDGSILFANVTPGHYILQNVEPPTGTTLTADVRVNVVPADLTKVPLLYATANGTPGPGPA